MLSLRTTRSRLTVASISSSSVASTHTICPTTSSKLFPQGSRAKHDIKVPDWGGYKRDDRPNSDPANKAFSYFMIGSMGFGAASGLKGTVRELLDTMNPAANVRALANIEVNISKVEEGTAIKMSWRGKPLFVRHRTQAEIDMALNQKVGELRDPQTDEERRKRPEWMVVMGICTHLGCVPLSGEGDYKGWFCPCHGSHYDTSGRIMKGPAPLNLEVPPYYFVDDDTLFIGEDQPAP